MLTHFTVALCLPSIEINALTMKFRNIAFSQTMGLKSYKTEFTQLGLVQRYPDIFESATFSFRTRLPSHTYPVNPAGESPTF